MPASFSWVCGLSSIDELGGGDSGSVMLQKEQVKNCRRLSISWLGMVVKERRG